MTITAAAPASASKDTRINAIVFASCLGTIIEWYDFLIYATAAALVFNKAFFPTFDPLGGYAGRARQLRRRLSGAAARRRAVRSFRRSARPQIDAGADAVHHGAQHLLHRPVADLRARSACLAPILLIVLRIVQGIGLGGEWGGASLMVLEHAPADKRGFYTSFVQIGFPIGLVLATLVFALVSKVAGRRFRRLWLADSVPDQHRVAGGRHLRALAGAGDAGVRRAQEARRLSKNPVRRSRRQRTPRHS